MQARTDGLQGDTQVAHDGDPRRLFLALWPDPRTRDALADAAAAVRARHPAQRRWIDPSRYHVTLRFLGDCTPAQQAAVLDAASAVHAQAFDLVVDRTGSFAGRSMPWWLGPSAPPADLQRLCERLDRALARAGVPLRARGPLVPHITILRGAAAALPASPIPAVHWHCREFLLVESAGGRLPAYHPLARWPLSAPAQPSTEPT